MKNLLNRTTKIIRVYFWPLLILIFLLELGVVVLVIQLGYFKDLDKSVTSLFESLLMLIATFTGILLPIIIARNLQREDDRRTLKFGLSSLWGEVRNNLHLLKQIRLNYSFTKIIEGIQDPLFLTEAIGQKISSLCAQDRLLSVDSYSSLTQSGSITTFDEDGYYNDINQAYENLFLFRSALLMMKENVEMKRYLFSQSHEPVNQHDTSLLVSEMIDQIAVCLRELENSILLNINASTSIEKKLSKLGIRAELVPRNVVKQSE